MNRRLEERFYLRLGRIVSIVLILVLIIYAASNSFYSIGNELTGRSDCQEYTCKGIDVKENTPAFKRFIEGIKDNNGVLVLGSSETGAFGINNYHGLLNEYFDCGYDFSVLAGAGRTAHIFFPPLLNNKEQFKDVNVLYFINPTYWRRSLNYFEMQYYERYNAVSKVYAIKEDLQDLGLYNDYAKSFLSENITDYKMEDFRESFIEIKNYFSNFDLEQKTETNGDATFSDVSKLDCSRKQSLKEIDSSHVLSLLDEIYLEKNITKAFSETNREKFVQIKESDFQMNALKGLNTICEDIGINITYILGPYNGVFCNYYNPDWCPAHEQTINEIRAF